MNFNVKFRNLVRTKFRKYSFVLLVVLFGGVIQTFSQKIDVDFNKTTIKEALEYLQAKHNFSLSMNISDIDMKKKISYKADKIDIKDVLNVIFKDQNVECTVKGKIITIKKSAKKDTKGKKVSLKGTVFDKATDTPLIGANLIILGTDNGEITNLDGEFNLDAFTSQIIKITCIGYEDKEIVVGEQTNLKIYLQESLFGLNEVVVTALGIKREKKALSYNVQEVKGDEFLKGKDANFVNSLSGKVAGVIVNSSSSGVGGASKVVMRGTKTIAQSSNALYVIDGVPMYNFGGGGDTEFGSKGATESIADINPEDIESLSVLTGAAAAALYGSSASNGAIVITTKKGKAGKTSITYSSSAEIMRTFRTPEFQNRYGTGDITSDVKVYDKSWGRKLNDENYMGYSPIDDFFNTAGVFTNSVSLSTGTDKNQTYVSSSYIDSEGIVPNNAYERLNFTFRNTTNFYNNRVKLDIGASYINQKDRNMVNQGTYANPLVTAYLFPRGDDWNDIKMYERYSSTRKISTQYWPQGIDEFTGQNPYWIAHRNIRENNKERYMMNTSLSVDITKWLNVAGRIRLDNSVNDYEEKLYASTNKTIAEGSDNGLYGMARTKNNQTYADIMVNIDKTLNDVFTIQANIGASYSDLKENSFSNKGPIRADGIPNLFNVFQLDDLSVKREQAEWHDQTQSLFGSAEFGYKSTYYITLTGRNDWPSQLAGPHSNKSSFFYPSAGTSVILSEALSLPQAINYLKVRASYASVGLPFARFLANPTYSWDNKNKVWQTKSHYPLYDLKPEKTESLEFGLTTKFLKYFDLDISYYQTKTFNQTFDPQISVSSGYSTLYVQTGNVKNQGIEMSLGFKKSWGDFSWNSNYTMSTNENEILELVDNYKHPETGQIINKERLDIGGLSNARFILKKGGSLGDLYSVADLKRDSEGNIFVDPKGNVSAEYNVEDIKLGSVFPKANMTWRNDFDYKNFNVGFMVSARLGGIVYSATQAAMDLYGVSKTSADARDNNGVVVNGTDVVDAQKWYTTIGAQSGIPQYYTYSATNVRLQEASIGYTIPRNKLGDIADVSLSLVGKNLLMIYCKAPFDPEAVATTGNYYQGIDNFMMPGLSSLSFNVRVKF